MALPNGYDTVIGEGGSSLSGGEKQRISIARAMLKDAPIVILDEATASIDPENEHLIQEAISALTHGKTIITIAHRLATIENADQILVIDEGTVAQKGTHKELLAQQGTYQDFIKFSGQASYIFLYELIIADMDLRQKNKAVPMLCHFPRQRRNLLLYS